VIALAKIGRARIAASFGSDYRNGWIDGSLVVVSTVAL